MRLKLSVSAFLLAVCACSISDQPVHPHPNLIGLPIADPSDTIVANFAFISCNRTSLADAQKENNASTANTPQLLQTLLDLSDTSLVTPTPQILFNIGDIVMNEATDQGETLATQLNAWSNTFKSKIPIPMIAIPGNHEMLQQIGTGETDEFPNPATQAIWLNWVTSNGWNLFSGNGPTPSTYSQDNLRFVDSKMTYSFDVNAGNSKIHFVVLNTDTQNTVTSSVNANYSTSGWIPLNWLKNDIEQAGKRSDISSIILIGHKPIVVPTDASEEPLNPNLGAQLQSFLATQPKFAFYIAGHVHQWTPQKAGTVQQFIVANGGSELEKNWFDGTDPTPEWESMGGPYFGFTVVSVHASGAIGISHVWRPANKKRGDYYLPGSTLQSKITKEVIVFQQLPL